jgi:hypothetical protein
MLLMCAFEQALKQFSHKNERVHLLERQNEIYKFTWIKNTEHPKGFTTGTVPALSPTSGAYLRRSP